MENNKKPKPKTRKKGLRPAQLPFSFLRCSAGILPPVLLLVSPFSGTGLPAVPGTLVYPELRMACAPPCCLLRHNPSNLGFTTASHSMNVRGQAEACPTETEFLIENPELEFSLSSIKTVHYKFLIANK